MGIISSLLRKNVDPNGQSVGQNQIDIELSSPAVNSTTTAEAEPNNSESSRNGRSEITNEETNICRIFKVQDLISDENIVQSFKPKILSIGPYHHGSSSSHLEVTESVKLRCQRNILGSISEDSYDGCRITTRAKDFYSEKYITMGEENFARMLLRDGCFILAALGLMRGDLTQLEFEALPWHDVVHDLLLVENQIPFLVLEEIRMLAAPIPGETTESLKEKIAASVKVELQHYTNAIDIREIHSKDFHHLLHLCHMFFRPSQIAVEHHRARAVTNLQWHRAVQYHEAGVEFRAKDPSTPHSLLDVTFSNGVMEIPRLSIDGQTESLFKNLIMFELGCPQVGKYMNAYIIFMSQLLSKPDDVELLAQRGIIEILGRADEVLRIFGRLNELAILPCWDDYYLKSTLRSVGAHYNRRSNWWFAWLKHKHCKNPFLALAALGAFIVLLCTVIQALFSVLQYFTPTK
ncbi:UPF0481 protein At3g47200-like [Ananas comosus]|uniref:UPF0481 protein At3g47200-like n=1 Tax=Ananas comosus TaxID=4615 RepID=A0A6P5FR49_ANACO|nr:UPF0481 protein At3g47200-like [Ananas comosus]